MQKWKKKLSGFINKVYLFIYLFIVYLMWTSQLHWTNQMHCCVLAHVLICNTCPYCELGCDGSFIPFHSLSVCCVLDQMTEFESTSANWRTAYHVHCMVWVVTMPCLVSLSKLQGKTNGTRVFMRIYYLVRWDILPSQRHLWHHFLLLLEHTGSLLRFFHIWCEWI